MNLFSETYNCYFQIMKEILSQTDGFTLDDLRASIRDTGFEESLLYIIPKLSSGEWNLLKKQDGLYYSKLSEHFYVPLSNLQKSYLKTILQDEKMQLFLDDCEIQKISEQLSDVPVLWDHDTFYYYDRFADPDPFGDPSYKKHFRTLLKAIETKCYVDIEYLSRTKARVHHHYLPCRLEYSIKNDKFRLLCIKNTQKRLHSSVDSLQKKTSAYSLEIINLERIEDVKLLDKHAFKDADINGLIQSTYYKEPVRLHIRNERNALERAMLHFANYEKNTTKISENLYECLIFYNQSMETELLIEVLSFGPMIKVLGNECFLHQLQQRLRRQSQLTQQD